ncbi:hypothetical protein RD149_01305 [Gordonia westfalica]|uniref:Uncharacterized protein n=1 Tax=Gordonia westfalica TaxID=158898 RepID=A0ABU2GN69_9ACTN|nr:hypothetical protein [Gordonia westfalica]MDS1112399.1 hypothetical protein [Gordonia westfalica]
MPGTAANHRRKIHDFLLLATQGNAAEINSLVHVPPIFSISPLHERNMIVSVGNGLSRTTASPIGLSTDEGETMGSLENIEFLTAIIDLLNSLGGGGES